MSCPVGWAPRRCPMTRTRVLQESRRMRFKEAYGGWQERRLTQEEAARLLGVCERTFRRYVDRYEDEGFLQCSASRSGLRPGRPCRHRYQCRRVRRIRARRSALVSRSLGTCCPGARQLARRAGARSLPRRRGRVLPEDRRRGRWRRHGRLQRHWEEVAKRLDQL